MENQKLTSGLKSRKMEVFQVDYSDFENFVQSVYGIGDYCFISDEEVSNDSTKLYQGIEGKLDEYEEKELEDFKQTGQGSYMSRTLLEDLCRQKLISPGNYLVDVCW